MNEKEYTKELIYNYIKYHVSFFNRVYPCTNENISEYLKYFDFLGKNSAISVLSSGDHIFNLIHNGISNIDSFDNNYLTEYYSLGIKKAMILKYNYKDYLHKYLDLLMGYYSFSKEKDFISKLLIYMDDKYALFWDEILKYNYDLQVNSRDKRLLISDIFIKKVINKDRIKVYNNYLDSDRDYEILKNNLKRSNISFTCMDILDIKNEFSNKYDFIILSNIFDYLDNLFGLGWNYEVLDNEIDKISNLLNDDGIILIHYLFKCMIEDNGIKSNLIAGSSIKYSDLVNEKICLFDFADSKFYPKNIKDALIYKKKKL